MTILAVSIKIFMLFVDKMKMKKTIKRFLLSAVVALSLTSCGGDKEHFDISLLAGKWVAGQEFWRYDANGTGATWDEADDVHEDEAQPFTWEFDDETNRLTHIHQMEMGGVVPKSYTLKALNDNTLSYTDRFDSTYTFKRVN